MKLSESTYHNYRATKGCLPKVGELKHPHLICETADIAALRERIKAGRPLALWNRLRANCDVYRDPKSPHFIDFEARDDGFALGPNRRGDLVDIVRAVAELSFADLICRQRSRGEFAAKVLGRLLEPGMVEKTGFRQPPARQSRRSGIPFGGEYHRDVARCNMDQHLAIAYDLTEPFMEDKQRKVVGDFLFFRTQLCWDHRWRAPRGTNNRTPRFHLEPAAESLALWGDRPETFLAEYPTFVEPFLEDYLEEGFSSDGTPWEGWHYGGCMSYLLNFAHMLNRKGIRHGLLDPRPVFKNLVLFYYLTRDSGDVAFTMAKAAPKVMVGFHMWLQIARFFEVPLARWWWRRRFDALCESPELAGFEALREQRVHLPMTMLFCDDAEPEASPQMLGIPSSHRFFKHGLVIARKDHNDDTPVFRLLAGPHPAIYGTNPHWHSFSISLSAYGQRLIVDPGKGKHRNMNLTSSHSSVLINGKGQEELCGKRPWPTLLDADAKLALMAGKFSLRSQPALIRWHEQDGPLEYIQATAVNSLYGVVADGYGDCKTAERHALVVHEGATPFYVVTCDIFDYGFDMSWREPTLDFVLVAAEDTELAVDEQGATITGPRARLLAELVTRDRVTARTGDVDAKHEGGNPNPRLIWSRKGSYGRMMTVLTPLRDKMEPPEVQLSADDESQTACVVRFGDCEDRISFWAPRDNIETEQAHTLKTGMRLKMVRRKAGKEVQVFTIPTLPGPYVVE